jgi:hypothetical protein
MATTRLPPHHCPHCSKLLNSATHAPGQPDIRPPEPDDITLCFGCGEFCLFTADMTLRKPTEDELIEIGLDPDARQARENWVQFQRRSA